MSDRTQIDDLLEKAALGDSSAAATAALVHATLQLVEQQRIANLIAKQTELTSGLQPGESLKLEAKARHRILEEKIRTALGIS